VGEVGLLHGCAVAAARHLGPAPDVDKRAAYSRGARIRSFGKIATPVGPSTRGAALMNGSAAEWIVWVCQ
jgi:hypothetical protein